MTKNTARGEVKTAEERAYSQAVTRTVGATGVICGCRAYSSLAMWKKVAIGDRVKVSYKKDLSGLHLYKDGVYLGDISTISTPPAYL